MVDSDDCNKALCYRVVSARNEVIEKGHSKSQACYAKDALAKVCCFINYKNGIIYQF